MHVKFEQFAAASMIGQEGSPPRSNGELVFQRIWEQRAFGIAIALSKRGYYEWEDFRQGLIASITSGKPRIERMTPTGIITNVG